jgi:hypothetical protein
MPASYGGAGMANNRPVMRDDNAGGAIMPINAINPYSSRYVHLLFVLSVYLL